MNRVRSRLGPWHAQRTKVAEASRLSSTENQRQDATATNEHAAYLEAWQSVDSDEGVPLAVAKRVFGQDPKAIIAELNDTLVG